MNDNEEDLLDGPLSHRSIVVATASDNAHDTPITTTTRDEDDLHSGVNNNNNNKDPHQHQPHQLMQHQQQHKHKQDTDIANNTLSTIAERNPSLADEYHPHPATADSDHPGSSNEEQTQRRKRRGSFFFRQALSSQEDSSQHQHHHQRHKHSSNRRSLIITSLILTLGAAASGAFLALGITAANKEEDDQFQRVAREYVKQLENDWTDYETAGLWTHQATRRSRLQANHTRTDFTELYENLLADGLEFQAICWLPNVTHPEREAYEAEAQRYYTSPQFLEAAHQTESFPYPGFRNSNGTLRSNQSFYFPIHYVEPFEGNQEAVGLDMYSHQETVEAIEKSVRTYKPAVSARLRLANQLPDEAFYSIFLMHPGIQISALPDMVSKDLSLMEVRIPALLKRTTQGFQEDLTVYLYDTTPLVNASEQFLGGVQVQDHGQSRRFLPEKLLKHVKNKENNRLGKKSYVYDKSMVVADRSWTVVILASRETYQPNYAYVILGGVLIFVGCAFLAVWEWSNRKRTAKFNELQAVAQAERQALIAEQKTVCAVRQLNDYLAHEVRNPVSAAITATCFIKDAVESPSSSSVPPSSSSSFDGDEQEEEGAYNKNQDDSSLWTLDAERRSQLQEDVTVVDNSLRFINDLLRNMLDMNRAASNQLRIDMAPTDLLKDVFEPVDSMLYRRNNSQIQVLVECPEHLVVMSDRLRLNQIILNLGRNSSKFVERGFIRLKAEVVNDGDNVLLSVEDSGCGIPVSKRSNLFEKFQDSLDSLSQGTGIGLSLCRQLVDLMGGTLYFDETYDSGIEGSPGTRFVIDLKTPPYRGTVEEEHKQDDESAAGLAMIKSAATSSSLSHTQASSQSFEDDNKLRTIMGGGDPAYAGGGGGFLDDKNTLELPETLSVLFVDDDFVLRKLFSRSLRKALPGWTVQEASNGETALRLVETETFDVIFMDQYMASVERQLLGTETVRSLRTNGVTCRICGLSANDMEQNFKDCGADAFMMKPFPCEPDALKAEMRRILFDCGQGEA